ncbi:cell wall hydrolase [Neobacillus niacini]|uniref:cell wall hydrolase n=1 Tax=Neobacillus niacini TaxID=86668 RepID=UPI002FFE3018
MKNTYFKKVTVACVATFAFIGLQNTTVEAITEYQVVKVDSLTTVGQPQDLILKEVQQAINSYDERKEYIAYKPNSKSLEIAKQAEEETPSLDTQSADPSIEAPEQEVVAPTLSISNEEKDLLARLVDAEAKGETFDGKVAVATVVLNRVDSPEFPNSISGVINEVVGGTYAFSPVQNGEINKPASNETVQAVEEALTRQDRLNDSIYFYNPEIATDKWITTREVVKTIGNHVFAK